MQYVAKSVSYLNFVVQMLAHHLEIQGVKCSHAECRDLVGKMHGVDINRVYSPLAVRAATFSAMTKDDDEVGPEVSADRRAHYISVLTNNGLDAAAAESIIDQVQPSRGLSVAPFRVKESRVKALAEQLRRLYHERGGPLFKTVRSQDIAARVLGYRNYALYFKANRNILVYSPSDDEAGAEIAAGRRYFQISALALEGFGVKNAIEIVGLLQPTRYSEQNETRTAAPEQTGREDTVMRDRLREVLKVRASLRRLLQCDLSSPGIDALYESDLLGSLQDHLEGDPAGLLITLLDLHEAGFGLVELRGWICAEIDRQIEHDVGEGVSLRETLQAIQRQTARLGAAQPLTEALRRQTAMLAFQSGVADAIADAASESEHDPDAGMQDGLDATRRFLADFDRLVQAGTSLADLAVALSETTGVGPVHADQNYPDHIDEVFKFLAKEPTRFGILDQVEAEASIRDSYFKMTRDGARQRLQNLFAPRPTARRGHPVLQFGVADRSFARPDGSRVLVSDILAEAHRAGISLLDLAVSARIALEIEINLLGAFPSLREAYPIGEIRHQFKVLFEPKGTLDAELGRAAVAMGLAYIDPDKGIDVSRLTELHRLFHDQVTLADLAAYEWASAAMSAVPAVPAVPAKAEMGLAAA